MSRGNRRFYRSLAVSLAALGVLVWVMLDQFDVPGREVGALLLGVLAVAAGVILLAGVFTGIRIALRRLTRRGQSPFPAERKTDANPSTRT